MARGREFWVLCCRHLFQSSLQRAEVIVSVISILLVSARQFDGDISVEDLDRDGQVRRPSSLRRYRGPDFCDTSKLPVC
jgi:hypothetical protein